MVQFELSGQSGTGADEEARKYESYHRDDARTEPEPEPEPEPEVLKPKRGRPKKNPPAVVKTTPAVELVEDEEMPPPKAKLTRTKSKVTLAESDSEVPAPARKSTKTKSASKPKARVVSDDEVIPEPKPSSKKGKGKANTVPGDEQRSEGADASPKAKAPPVIKLRKSKGRKSGSTSTGIPRRMYSFAIVDIIFIIYTYYRRTDARSRKHSSSLLDRTLLSSRRSLDTSRPNKGDCE